jgi:hypothetical protein
MPAIPAIRLTSLGTVIELNPFTFGAVNLRTLTRELAQRQIEIPRDVLDWIEWELGPAD